MYIFFSFLIYMLGVLFLYFFPHPSQDMLDVNVLAHSPVYMYTTEPTRYMLTFSFAAQCIYTVTEDNKDALQQMEAHEALLFLDTLLTRRPGSAHEMLMQSLLAGLYIIPVRSINSNLINTFLGISPIYLNFAGLYTFAILTKINVGC